MILKNISKKNIVFFIILTLGLVLSPVFAFAQYNPLVSIPGITGSAGVTGYLGGLYSFLISVVGIVAMGAIVIGGARYLTSAGNPSAVEDAKHTIYQAIYGLLLALTSWVIVKEINPDILVLKNPAVTMNSGRYNSGAFDISKCAIPGGDGLTTKTACYCVDNTKQPVTFTTPPPPPLLYVVSPSIPACSSGIPTTLSSVDFVFNKPIASASVNLGTTVLFQFNTGSEGVVSTAVSGSTITVKWTGTLAVATPKEISITAGVKDTAGDAATAYDLRFTTATSTFVGCVPPVPVVIDCTVACSNPSTPGLTPAGYHCLKADLRVGSTAKSVGESAVINSGDSLYFDGRSYSADFGYPGLNLGPDPYVAASGFVNGIDRYEINCVGSNPAGLCGFFSGISYGCSESTTCSILGLIGWGVNAFTQFGVCGIDASTKNDALGYAFSSPGTYTIELVVYGRTTCATASKRVYITVNP